MDRIRRLSEAGLDGRPTLVHNVETLAQLALVARFGAAWFRSVGHPSDPGTRLVTVTGRGDRRSRRGADGHRHRRHRPSRGGRSAASCGRACRRLPRDLARPCGRVERRSTRVSAGDGGKRGRLGLHVLGDQRCGLAVTAGITTELAAASAGQCGPCRFGLPTIASRFAELAAGRAAPHAADELARLAELVDGRGACHHPDGTARLVRSALRVFGKDVHAHAAGRCTRLPGNGGGR